MSFVKWVQIKNANLERVHINNCMIWAPSTKSFQGPLWYFADIPGIPTQTQLLRTWLRNSLAGKTGVICFLLALTAFYHHFNLYFWSATQHMIRFIVLIWNIQSPSYVDCISIRTKLYGLSTGRKLCHVKF